MVEGVRQQYEKFPYPHVPALALPRAGQGHALRFEYGADLLQHNLNIKMDSSHVGKTILVAGCGTIEALVVAMQHPHAKKLTAVDLSLASLSRLKRKVQLKKINSPLGLVFKNLGLPPIEYVNADLFSWEGGAFDYIISTNVLHHTPDPAGLLNRLASWLKPGGLLRLVTYPKHSRLWMRLTAAFLKSQGLTQETPDLVKKSKEAIQKLDEKDPRRQCFFSQPEIHRANTLIDAFYHALENPLSPLEWKEAGDQAGLTWVAEAQNESSQSIFLSELLPKTAKLEPWIRLQIMDDLLELCDNPVIWFYRDALPLRRGGVTPPVLANTVISNTAGNYGRGNPAPTQNIETEIAAGLKRAQNLLQFADVTLDEALTALTEHVGPRVMNDKNETRLYGLSVTEYDWKNLLTDARK